jgi:hypothetical protein
VFKPVGAETAALENVGLRSGYFTEVGRRHSYTFLFATWVNHVVMQYLVFLTLHRNLSLLLVIWLNLSYFMTKFLLDYVRIGKY